jgi:hypothetical protein
MWRDLHTIYAATLAVDKLVCTCDQVLTGKDRLVVAITAIFENLLSKLAAFHIHFIYAIYPASSIS